MTATLPRDLELLPVATEFYTIKGNRKDNERLYVGPTWDTGEYLTIVSQFYDPDSDTTRIGLVYGIVTIQGQPLAEFPPEVKQAIMAEAMRAHSNDWASTPAPSRPAIRTKRR